jgi:MFS family permease
MMVSASYVMVQVPYAALMADCTPRELRGLSSGLMGALTTVGMLLGALSSAFLIDIGVVPFYLLMMAVLCVTGRAGKPARAARGWGPLATVRHSQGR